MKQIIFTYEGYANTNIGDYIQSLAAKQFSKEGEVIYYHRDELSKYDGEPVKAIMNGWFTHRKENWPPSDKINPLFVAIHFNSSAYDVLLGDKSVEYLSKFEPIGCRDQNTADELEKKGLKAYFSSCLTTTLGYKYANKGSARKGVCIVDPVHFIPEMNRKFKRYVFLKDYIRYKKGIDFYVKKLRADNSYEITWNKNKMNVLACATRAYILLRKLLTKEDLRNARILTQYHSSEEIPENEERFKRAEELLSIYRNSELVITSRIHCALPCLGLRTPVIFLQNMEDTIESRCRFNGLLDLLNVVEFKKNKLLNSKWKLPLIMSEVNNPNSYIDLSKKLIIKCREFIGK